MQSTRRTRRPTSDVGVDDVLTCFPRSLNLDIVYIISLPPKTSTHCPYSLRKRHHYYQSHVEYPQYKNSFIIRLLLCLTFNDCDWCMSIAMIMLKWRWIRDCIYYLIIVFSMFYFMFLLVMCFNCSCHRLTVCVGLCHAGIIKGYLLT